MRALYDLHLLVRDRARILATPEPPHMASRASLRLMRAFYDLHLLVRDRACILQRQSRLTWLHVPPYV